MKCNKVESINIEEIHKIHAKMLKEVVEFLDENNIAYYLDYGTLIGAIRHRGFIPWDDDIDISMTRPDYEKLMDIAKKNKNKINEHLYITSLELNNSIFPFCKIYNTQYGVKEEYIDVKEGEFLWIDIFPYDGLSGDNKKDLKLVKHVHFWRKLWLIKLGKYLMVWRNSKKIYKAILKMLMKIFVNIFPAEFYAKKMKKVATKHPYKNCDTVQNVIWSLKLYEGISKERIKNKILVDFENDKYSAIESYDKYLKSIYGDYMQLPPEDERATHLVEIWKIGEDK